MIRKLASSELRGQAIALRLAGKSRREIKALLGIGSNQTLNNALRGVPPAWARDMPRQGRLSYAECRQRQADGVASYWATNRPVREARRQAVRDGACAQIGGLSDREILIAGAVAYWCEGSKNRGDSSRDRVVFINSDPHLISFYLRFLAVAGITADRLICRVYIHETGDMMAAQRFWQRVTGLPPEQFRRPSLKHHNPKTVRKDTGPDYHGCLVISVRQSAELYRQIAGWASAAMAAKQLVKRSPHVI